MTDLNKDLLQEVIGKEYKILKITKYSIKVIHEEAFNSVEWCEHKVAHKCKEWAKNKGYVVGTDLDKVNVWSIKERIIVNHFEVYFEDYLEFEIKACQWILDNKD